VKSRKAKTEGKTERSLADRAVREREGNQYNCSDMRRGCLTFVSDKSALDLNHSTSTDTAFRISKYLVLFPVSILSVILDLLVTH
jgi:hypothetical protein